MTDKLDPVFMTAFVAGYVVILAALLTGAAEVMGAIRRRASLAALGAP